MMISVSNDGGATYSKPVDLSNRAVTNNYGLAVPVPFGSFYCEFSPEVSNTSPQIRIAVSGTNVYVAWGEREYYTGDDLEQGHNFGVFFAHSSNGGATFSTAVNLATKPYNTAGTGSALAPVLAASGSNVLVAWEDRGSGKNVFYERSADGGQTFNGGSSGNPVGAPIDLSNNGNSAVPQVGAAGTTFFIVWQDDGSSTGDIGLVKSNDGGATFSKELNLSKDGVASSPQLAVSASGSAYVAWQDGSQSSTVSLGDILVGGSSDGVTSMAPVDMTDFHGSTQPAIGDAYNPQIAVGTTGGSNVVYVAWLDTSPGYAAVYAGVMTSTHTAVRVSDNTLFPSNPRIAAVGGDFYLTWSALGNQIQFLIGTSSSGGTCCNGVTISATGPTNDGRGQPVISIGGENVAVAWHDHTMPNGQVYVREDAISPQPPAITSPANGATVNTLTPTISGTSDPPLTIQVFDGSTMVGSTSPNPVSGAWSVTTSPLSVGSHTITAKAVDSTGTSTASAAVTITVSSTSVTTTPEFPASSLWLVLLAGILSTILLSRLLRGRGPPRPFGVPA
jgi:hypothetical protein